MRRFVLTKLLACRANSTATSFSSSGGARLGSYARPTKRRRQLDRTKQPNSKKRKAHKFSSRENKIISSLSTLSSDGFVMPLITLEFAVLKSIFKYAAGTEVNAKWLVGVACICKAFAEPALAALYSSPPITSPSRGHKIVELVANHATTPNNYNYQNKIKHLSIDVGEVAARSFHGHHLDLPRLLRSLPALQSVELYHTKDFPPYRSLHDSLRWSYDDKLFAALGVNGELEGTNLALRRLQSWHWSSRMLGSLTLADMRKIHESTPFRHLRKLSLVNFQLSWARESGMAKEDEQTEAQDDEYIKRLASSIVVLPHLEHLHIEASTVVNGVFIDMLPRNLKIIEFINSWELTSEELADFFMTHGSQIEVLRLLHNESLSLSFLTVLGKSCPELKQLWIDLNYYRPTENAVTELVGAQPFYTELLEVGQVPQWPKSLEVIDIQNMHRWDREAADMFFNSLASSAPTLPMLRHLSISARLTISWRDRSVMRDHWVAMLRKIYQRPSKNPLEYFSLKDFGKQHEKAEAPNGIEIELDEKVAEKRQTPSNCNCKRRRSTPRRISSRRAKVLSYKDPDTEDSDIDPVSRGSGTSSSELSELSDISEFYTIADQILIPETKKWFVQGKCDVVEITIDNQKPVENPFEMGDFMDDTEDDSDSDWDGNDPEEPTGYMYI